MRIPQDDMLRCMVGIWICCHNRYNNAQAVIDQVFYTKLHRGFRILAYVRSRRLEPNVRQKSDLEARARREKRR